MEHTPVIIETKEVTDEYVGYRVRCCDDPMTDSWHTAIVGQDHTESLKAHCDRVADTHAKKVAWREAQKKASVQTATPAPQAQ